MAQKTDIGVSRDTTSTIVAVPLVSDIGVPTQDPLNNLDETDPQLGKDDQVDTNPDARIQDQLGIGVPYNPADGAITE